MTLLPYAVLKAPGAKSALDKSYALKAQPNAYAMFWRAVLTS
jgi:hypothetical protein